MRSDAPKPTPTPHVMVTIIAGVTRVFAAGVVANTTFRPGAHQTTERVLEGTHGARGHPMVTRWGSRRGPSGYSRGAHGYSLDAAKRGCRARFRRTLSSPPATTMVRAPPRFHKWAHPKQSTRRVPESTLRPPTTTMVRAPPRFHKWAHQTEYPSSTPEYPCSAPD